MSGQDRAREAAEKIFAAVEFDQDNQRQVLPRMDEVAEIIREAYGSPQPSVDGEPIEVVAEHGDVISQAAL